MATREKRDCYRVCKPLDDEMLYVDACNGDSVLDNQSLSLNVTTSSSSSSAALVLSYWLTSTDTVPSSSNVSSSKFLSRSKS